MSGGSESPQRIAIWGHYHGHNLGDELVVSTIVSAIRRRRPEAEIVGISMTPGDTQTRHGIGAYPINPGMPATRARGSAEPPSAPPSRRRRLLGRIPGARRAYQSLKLARAIAAELPFAWRSYRFLRGIDLIVVAGSGQLLDEWRGPWRHPYATFRWALLARLAHVPMAYPSVGAGPIESRLGAFFIRTAVSSARFVSVRDRNSGKVLEAIGLPGPIPFCPDMGYGYPGLYPGPRVDPPPETTPRPIVGLNVMAHQDPRLWPRGTSTRYEAYLEKMVAFARRLLARGCTVRVFSSQTGSDDVAAAEFREALGNPPGPGRVEWTGGEIEAIDDLVSAIASCDDVIAARFHSVLVPVALGIPTLGLAYNPKTSELLADVGLADRCLDIDSFTVEELEQAFDRLETEPLPPSVREQVEAHRVAVEAQFDALFGRISPRSPDRGVRARTGRG